MRTKKRFDNIIEAFGYRKRVWYVKTEQDKKKCTELHSEIEDDEITTYMSICLDGKVYYIATTLSKWFIEYIVFCIVTPT